MEHARFADTVGAHVRKCRELHGLTLEDVARSGRLYGATWNLSSVRAIEAGRAATSLPNLLILALALGDLTGEPMRLSDFFTDGSSFDPPHFRGGAPISSEWLRSVLSGDQVKPPSRATRLDQPDEFSPWSAPSSSLLSDEGVSRAMETRGPGPMSRAEKGQAFAGFLDDYQDPESHSTDALSAAGPTVVVRRASAKLGISPLELEGHARRLWGNAFEVEVLKRAGSGSNAQVRGHVTRRLLNEVGKFMQSESN